MVPSGTTTGTSNLGSDASRVQLSKHYQEVVVKLKKKKKKLIDFVVIHAFILWNELHPHWKKATITLCWCMLFDTGNRQNTVCAHDPETTE